MAIKDTQLKLLTVGLGLLAQFGAMIFIYTEFKTKTELEIRNIVSEQKDRNPIFERFIAMEQQGRDHERRIGNLERQISWSRRREEKPE